MTQKKKDFKPEIVWRDPKELTPYVKNAKVHPTEQIDKVAGQIAAVGFTQPIVVDANGVIIAGHARREASIRLNLDKVPVIVASHLDEHEAMAARIADNKVAESFWDPELLKFDLGSLNLRNFNMDLTGFEKTNIESILKPDNAETLFPENRHKSVSERKEGYENSDLRQIILVCDQETFERVMGQFQELQSDFAVETNIEIIEKLLKFYAENRTE